MKKVICIIGKGHSGTRFLASTLQSSGVYMGEELNSSMDKGPYHTFFDIMDMPVNYVSSKINLPCNSEWNFSKMLTESIPSDFTDKFKKYIKDIEDYNGELAGWKLTENNLVYPWMARLYPDWYYIHLVRDVRDSFSRPEHSDTLKHTYLFNIPSYIPSRNKNTPPENHMVSALNWKYHLDIVKSAPVENYIRLKLEDLVTNQDEEIDKLSNFLGFKVKKIHAKPEVVESWRERDGVDWQNLSKTPIKFKKGKPGPSSRFQCNWEEYSFLDDYMEEFKYPDWPTMGNHKEYRRK